MPREQEPKWNLEELTDTDIFAAIRYLDPDPRAETNREGHSTPVAILLDHFASPAGLCWP
jgi:hypothetical protein